MSSELSVEKFEVVCNYCKGKFFLEKEPDANWSCICKNKPRPWSILNHCSNGHTSWLKNMNGECEECQKQKTIKTAKRLLQIQSDPKRQKILQNIVDTNRIFHSKKLDYIKKKKQVDDSILEIPNLLKDIIKTVNSMKKDDENSKKLDDLDSKLKELETRFVQ